MDKAFNFFEWFNQPSTASSLGMTNLMKINNGLNTVDNRVVYMDTSKAEASVVNNTVQSITYNELTGVMTITKVNGTVVTIDTKLEKLAVNFAYNPDTQQLDITLDDGTVQHVDLSSLITQYEFQDSDTIMWTLVNGVIKADIINGSITAEKLQPNYLADIIVQAQTATNQAALSKRYAVGGVEAGDEIDNAKYYKEQAKLYRDQAQAIVGFDPATKLNKSNADTATDGQVLTSNGDGTYSFQDSTGGDTDTANSTVTFSEAATLANIASTETHAALFGKIKKFFSFIGTAALTTVATTITGAINEIKSGIENIASALYNPAATYALGDYCIRDWTLYKCTTAITTPEAWTIAHWTACKIGTEIKALNDNLAVTNGSITNNAALSANNSVLKKYGSIKTLDLNVNFTGALTNTAFVDVGTISNSAYFPSHSIYSTGFDGAYGLIVVFISTAGEIKIRPINAVGVGIPIYAEVSFI